jgi:iron-sulfur cluster assembly protein
MIDLTQKARDVVRRLIARSSDGATGLRIMVEQGGCVGLQYALGLDKAADIDDEVFDLDGVRVFVDPESLALISGLTIDFVEDVDKSGFVFDNPRALALCSCGKSFGA